MSAHLSTRCMASIYPPAHPCLSRGWGGVGKGERGGRGRAEGYKVEGRERGAEYERVEGGKRVDRRRKRREEKKGGDKRYRRRKEEIGG